MKDNMQYKTIYTYELDKYKNLRAKGWKTLRFGKIKTYLYKEKETAK